MFKYIVAIILFSNTAYASCNTSLLPSGGNDTINIQTALAASSCVELSAATYKVCNLNIPTRGFLRGLGRNTLLQKICIGDAVIMGTNSRLFDIEIDGSLFAGGAIAIFPNATNQIIERIVAYGQSGAIEFRGSGAGNGAVIFNSSLIAWPNTNVWAVTLPADGLEGGRRFRDIAFSGGNGIDLGGSSNTVLDNINGSILFHDSPRTRRVVIVNSRLGAPLPGTGTLDIHGDNHVIGPGNATFPPIDLTADTVGVAVQDYSAIIYDHGTGNRCVGCIFQ